MYQNCNKYSSDRLHLNTTQKTAVSDLC